MRPLRILTWHVHGTYLWALAHLHHELYLPVRPHRPPGYGGRCGAWPWPGNVHEVPVDDVADLPLDAVLYQIGAAGRDLARDRFNVNRFVRDWDALLGELCGTAWSSGRRTA